MSEIQLIELDTLDCRLEPSPWAFAHDNKGAIEAHWQGIVARKPASFNGQILLLHRWEIVDRVFRGAYHISDYASFLAWRDFGHAGERRWNCFSMAALQAADGAFLLGEMADHTSNAGAIYFAAGTPDLSDLRGDLVDLDGSVMREMEEETGITADNVTVASGWTAVLHGPRIAMMRNVRSSLQAPDLKKKIEVFLAGDDHAELSAMHIVADRSDILPGRMPAFQCAYLEHKLAR